MVETVEDVVLGGWSIPRGTQLFMLTRPGVLDPRRFADPQTFAPERWLTSGGDAAAHMPFGSGPRICPGRTLALTEMRVVLHMLARHFDFRRPAGAASQVCASISRSPCRRPPCG